MKGLHHQVEKIQVLENQSLLQILNSFFNQRFKEKVQKELSSLEKQLNQLYLFITYLGGWESSISYHPTSYTLFYQLYCILLVTLYPTRYPEFYQLYIILLVILYPTSYTVSYQLSCILLVIFYPTLLFQRVGISWKSSIAYHPSSSNFTKLTWNLTPQLKLDINKAIQVAHLRKQLK